MPTIVVFCSVVILYFTPALLGRKKRNALAIFCLNLLTGWTVIGWVAALIWAVSYEKALDSGRERV